MNRRNFFRGAAATAASVTLPAAAALAPPDTTVVIFHDGYVEVPNHVFAKARQHGMTNLAMDLRSQGYQIREHDDVGRELIRDAARGREFDRIQLEQLRQQRQIEADDRLQERIRADTRRQSDDFDRIYRDLKRRNASN